MYLRHNNVITKVNLQDHTYQDVKHSPVQEFDSASFSLIGKAMSSIEDPRDVWLCDHGQYFPEIGKEQMTIEVEDEAYMPLPFLKDTIDPYGWSHILATLDTCTLPKQTQFYDKDGYDVIPIRVVFYYECNPEELNYVVRLFSGTIFLLADGAWVGLCI